MTAKDYAQEVRVYQREIGNLDWVAPMDWMCEPWIVQNTSWKSLHVHQALTVLNFRKLREDEGLHLVIPVLQGWKKDDYLRCVDLYDRAGVDLGSEPLVGVGSVCRRQGTGDARDIFAALHGLGLRLHGFGVKIAGLKQYGQALVSSDSMAWSYRARRSDPLPGHTHKNCANCLEYALKWRKERVMEVVV